MDEIDSFTRAGKRSRIEDNAALSTSIATALPNKSVTALTEDIRWTDFCSIELIATITLVSNFGLVVAESVDSSNIRVRSCIAN